MISKPLLQRLCWGISTAVLFLSLIGFTYIFWVNVVFILFISLVIGLTLKEYVVMCREKSFYPITWVLYGLSIVYSLIVGFYYTSFYATPLILSLFFLMLFLPFLTMLKSKEQSIANLATTFFGFVYITLPISVSIMINNFFPLSHAQSGALWLIYLIVTTKICDTAAFFTGRSLGKTKLAEEISPKKTVEGSIGGLLGSMVMSWIFWALTPIALGMVEALLIGLVIGVLAQIGDLSESLIKRDAKVKDSSNIPGLGGVLDVMDSLTFTFPFIFIYLTYKWPVL